MKRDCNYIYLEQGYEQHNITCFILSREADSLVYFNLYSERSVVIVTIVTTGKGRKKTAEKVTKITIIRWLLWILPLLPQTHLDRLPITISHGFLNEDVVDPYIVLIVYKTPRTACLYVFQMFSWQQNRSLQGQEERWKCVYSRDNIS